MSYTIVEDPSETGIPAIHIRAMISTRSELEDLIARLNRRLETDFAQEENHEHNARSVRSDPSAPNAIAAGTNLNDGPAKTS